MKALRDWQIHVLEVQPSGYGDALIARLYIVDLLYDSSVLILGTAIKLEYDALSYCSGNPDRCRELKRNGTTSAITDEAFRAL